MTRRGKILIASVLLVAVACISIALAPSEVKYESDGNSVGIEVPEGDGPEVESSKRSAYESFTGSRNGNVEEYFASLASQDERDVQGKETVDADAARTAERHSPADAGVSAPKSESVMRDLVGDLDGGSDESSVEAADRRNREYERSITGGGGQGALSYREQRALDSLRYRRMGEVIAAGRPEPVQEQAQVPEPAQVQDPPRIEVTTLPEGSSPDGIISSLDDGPEMDGMQAESLRPVKCMFIRDEKIESGQRVMVRILEPIRLEGMLIPENTHLSAICSFSERLNLTVSSIEVGGYIYPVNYDAYDYDGMLGIYCPQSSRESSRRQARQSAQSIGQSALGNIITGSLAGQIVNAGANVVSSSGSRTVIHLTAGYTFYLARTVK